jgi:hypothetical protein
LKRSSQRRGDRSEDPLWQRDEVLGSPAHELALGLSFSGLRPDGDPGPGGAARPASVHVVDHRWAATEWTLARAVRTSRFWWIFVGYFTCLFAWYAVQALL